MTEVSTTPPARYANGRFGPGNPGRRPGTRNQASHRAAMIVLEHFGQNREFILDRLGRTYTPAYAALLARLLPKQVEIVSPPIEDVPDAEIARMIAEARAALDGGDNARGALIELEAILIGEAGGDHRNNGNLR